MGFIRIRNFKKVYDQNNLVLDHFNLDIEEKEFVVLLGPSGCGKSTLLRMIAGLEDITAGDLFINEKRMNDARPRERNIAMVFQNYALYPHMTIYDNIAFGLRRMHLPAGEISKRIDDVSEMLHISEYYDKRPDQLSGGQQQRVAIARAIVKTPQVFLFDEPLSNLDAKLRNSLRSEIKKLHIRLDTTTIYVTHDQLEAMTLADRIILMHGGKIEQSGSPGEIYNWPRTRFAAGFIGSPAMNFFPVTIVKDGSGRAVDGKGFKLTLPDGMFNPSGRDGTLGIRPAHIELSDKEKPGAVKIKVDMLENMGEETLVTFFVGDVQAMAMVPAEDEPEMGEEMWAYFTPDKLHLFSADSGLTMRADGVYSESLRILRESRRAMR